MRRSISAALLAGPRFLGSSWAVRGWLHAAAGGVLGPLVLLALPPVLLLGVTRRLRRGLWDGVLRAVLGRLAVVAPAMAREASDRLERDLDEGDAPRARHLAAAAWTIASGLLGLPLVVLGPIVVVVLLGAPVLVPRDGVDIGPWHPDGALDAVLATLLGLALVPVLTYLVGLLGAADEAVLGRLLGPTEEMLRREVGRLRASRAGLVATSSHERSRIEAELHDRVQHRLVALGMTLGIAESADPDGETGRLAASARAEVLETLAELRAVVDGLQPRALADHGVAAAARDLAARSPLDVRVDVEGCRLPAEVEEASHAVVAEALTNAVKHGGATSAVVTGARTGGRWQITVVDDGHGGADPTAGAGLVGLAHRAEGVDGRLWVVSPDGGPTEVGFECPVPISR